MASDTKIHSTGQARLALLSYDTMLEVGEPSISTGVMSVTSTNSARVGTPTYMRSTGELQFRARPY